MSQDAEERIQPEADRAEVAIALAMHAQSVSPVNELPYLINTLPVLIGDTSTIKGSCLEKHTSVVLGKVSQHLNLQKIRGNLCVGKRSRQG